MSDHWSNAAADDMYVGSMPRPTRLRSCLAFIALVLFSGSASLGQVAVDVELIPDKAGPYYAGQHITVDVWLHSQLPDDFVLSRIAFDFADTDSSLILDAQFAFDFSSVVIQPSGYEGTTFPDLPVPWTAQTIGCFCPDEFIPLPAQGSRHIGSIGLTIPSGEGAGSFKLDVMNRTNPSPSIGTIGAILVSSAACIACPEGSFWTAFDGALTGGQMTLTSIGPIPAASTWGLAALIAGLAIAASVLLKKRRGFDAVR